MKTLFKMSIFLMIVIFLAKIPSYTPKTEQESKEVKVESIQAVVQPEEKKVEVIPEKKFEPVKTDEIEDGVWEHRDLIAKYFPEDQVQNALRIASKENGSGDPAKIGYNRNGSFDTGIFQINSVHADRVDGDLSKLKDADTNVRVAFEIWSEQGWKPWVTAKKLGL
jgi:hypothetical protein